MVRKKFGALFIWFLIFSLIFLALEMSAITSAALQVEKTAISDVVISELEGPAIFNFKIKNLGSADNFEIYSLVGVDFSPRGMFQILGGETKEIIVEVYPNEQVREKERIFNFVYKIRSQSGEIFEDKLTINIVKLKELFEVSADNIAPDTTSAVIYIQNMENVNIENIKAMFSSVFFQQEENFSIGPYEKKQFVVQLNREKMKKIIAGTYKLLADIKIDKVNEKIEGAIKFVEQEGISTDEKRTGNIIYRQSITKTNEGNVPAVVEVVVQRNIFSKIFTTFNTAPTKIERKKLTMTYAWTKDLAPLEKIEVVAKTNYIYPLVILILIVIAIISLKLYYEAHLILTKRVAFVKTKGGEFALKISIYARAKRFVEKITIIDRLPPIMKIYERYGAVAPDRIDEKNRRLEWNIESLSPGDERVFSYVVYSKVGMVGRIAIPPTTAIYERNGRLREIESNYVYLLTEEKRKAEE